MYFYHCVTVTTTTCNYRRWLYHWYVDSYQRKCMRRQSGFQGFLMLFVLLFLHTASQGCYGSIITCMGCDPMPQMSCAIVCLRHIGASKSTFNLKTYHPFHLFIPFGALCIWKFLLSPLPWRAGSTKACGAGAVWCNMVQSYAFTKSAGSWHR